MSNEVDSVSLNDLQITPADPRQYDFFIYF